MAGPLSDKFGFSPHSVLNAASPEWRDRKHEWLELGIKSEVGRKKNLLNMSATVSVPDPELRQKMIDEGETIEGHTSVFDPVLCEIAYRWFAPARAQVIDPFAGGSVRGIVAGCCDLNYWGCELRPEQVDANRLQAEDIAENFPDNLRKEFIPQWVVGDSSVMLDDAPEADFLFSCPPYGNREEYRDDPNDLSNMEYEDFLAAYGKIIEKSMKKLRNDRFACFVVADYRDRKNGKLRGFVARTMDAFENAGAEFYNSAILRTPTGSAGIRTRRIFGSNRKLVPVHQKVLVFCKGDPSKAAAKAKRV